MAAKVSATHLLHAKPYGLSEVFFMAYDRCMVNMAAMPLSIVVLAAGAGSRMRSDLPKPLHRVGGAPLIEHVLRSASDLSPQRIVVVVGSAADSVSAVARAVRQDVVIATQDRALGTGDAVRAALSVIDPGEGALLVVFADTPLLRAETLRSLVGRLEHGAAVAVLGFTPDHPDAYGRLTLSADGMPTAIVEAADATPEQAALRLCNAGAMALDLRLAREWIAALEPRNAQGEYYLTDVVAAAAAQDMRRSAVVCEVAEALGVNTRADLAAAEAAFQARARAQALDSGVTMTAPETVWLALDTRLGRDVTIGPNVVFGLGVAVEDEVDIGAFTSLEGCRLRRGACVGPFARLRPGADVGGRARVGNFVEIKNAVLGPEAKANHLAYVGDADVGARANLGAGTITCNYDGVAKHRTRIGAEAFIGSNTALVAPVTVGDGAYVGSGSVITSNVPADALAIGRSRQIVKPSLAARLRARLTGAARSVNGKD